MAASATAATAPVALALGLRGGVAIALASLVALTLIGWHLWHTSTEPDSKTGALGAGLLVSAIVALAVGYGQYEIERTVRSIEEQRQALSQRQAERQNLQLTISTQRQLSGIDLQARDLSRFYLRNRDFTTANFAEADLRGADLRESILIGADLRGADLRRAVLGEADLRAADLGTFRVGTSGSRRRDLSARLSAAQVASHEAAMEIIGGINGHIDRAAIEARVSQLDERRQRIWFPRTVRRRSVARNAFFVGADLRGADLEGVDLRGADFSFAALGRAFLNGADLRDATLDAANLRDVDLSGALLGGASVHGADYDSDTRWPSHFNPRAGGANRVRE